MPTPANPLNVTTVGAVTYNGTTFSSGILPITQGGTNATSYTQSNGIITYNGTSLVNYAGPQIDSSGRTTNTSQPAVFAYVSTPIPNVTGNAVRYTVVFDTVVFDQTSSYNNSTGIFTAPVTGKYCISTSVAIDGLGVSGLIGLITPTAGTSLPGFFPASLQPAGRGLNTWYYLKGSLFVDVAASDTLSVWAIVESGPQTASVEASFSTFLSIYLVC